MSDLFGSTAQPRWMEPEQRTAILEEQGRQNAEPFVRSFGRAFEMANERAYQEKQLADTREMLKPIAGALRGVTTLDGALKIVGEHPEWMMDPKTAPYLSATLKNFGTAESIKAATDRAQAGTVAGKTAIKDLSEFTKRIDLLPPEDRASIKQMTPNQDGTPSRMQWDALGLAEQTLAQRKKNEADLATLEAEKRGDRMATTIDSKGNVVKRFTPATDNSMYAESPKVIEADGKKFLQWGKQLRDLNTMDPADKAQIGIITAGIRALQAKLIKDPEDQDAALKPNSLTRRLVGEQRKLDNYFTKRNAAQPMVNDLTKPRPVVEDDLVYRPKPGDKDVKAENMPYFPSEKEKGVKAEPMSYEDFLNWKNK